MKINSREKSYKVNGIAYSLINYLQVHESVLNLVESSLYYDFPIFKDVDGDIVISQVLLISVNHGIILVSLSSNGDSSDESLANNIDQLHSIVFSRLLRNKNLRRSKTELNFPIHSLVFADSKARNENLDEDVPWIANFAELEEYLKGKQIESIAPDSYLEIIATIEGAKGIIKPKERDAVTSKKPKGHAASEIEKEINSFDEFQKKAFINEINGPERIRGLAGSGKTVILALKAAIAHLRDPNANIAYTFSTKSLYQHIQRLITRFYRQYDDKDPDWNKLQILHAWGSSSAPGIYYEATVRNKVRFYSLSEATAEKPRNPFDLACSTLLSASDVQPIYDYVFIDEGQDFPISFLRLCLKLARRGKIVWAYDELQTIFQVKTPDISAVLEGSQYQGLEEDVILYKCYRNPREILITAHAIGFGIYGKKIVQMVDEPDYWSDIGYKVIQGDFKEGDKIIIERPIENPLETVSKQFDKNDIVKFQSLPSYSVEIKQVVTNILKELEDGLLPDDILVVVVDDRNAKTYLTDIQILLAGKGVMTNNVHADKFSIKDFIIPDHVTLSTVHKAKGNEAYSVHVVGIDSLYSLEPTIKERNLMFTAMTRAKGWVSLTGIGSAATNWIEELVVALKNSPNLEFVYPSSEELRIMKRDIKDKATRKSKQAKILDELLAELSPEEIKQFLDQREVTKKKKLE